MGEKQVFKKQRKLTVTSPKAKKSRSRTNASGEKKFMNPLLMMDGSKNHLAKLMEEKEQLTKSSSTDGLNNVGKWKESATVKRDRSSTLFNSHATRIKTE